MSTFATAVSASISNGGIDMWTVSELLAVDDKTGSYVSLANGVVKICRTKNSVSVLRRVKVKETPPCLSVAVNDFLKLLAKEDTA